MTLTLTSLGRETPYFLQTTQDSLIVAYHDALSVYAPKSDALFELQAESLNCTEACSILSGDGPDWQAVVSEGKVLRFYDHQLQSLQTVDTGQEEDITNLLGLNQNSFLAVNDASEVVYWARTEDQTFAALSQWVVECVPLFPKGGGKTVICTERGRIQERDAKTGTVLATWPASALADWGISDPSGHHALTLNGKGEACMWDMSSRELLFGLNVDFPVSRATFEAGGLGGALLGANGECASFKLVDGGDTTGVEGPESPLVSLSYQQSELLGIDENGGLWSLTKEGPVFKGGTWAGWATCSCFLGPDRILVGTATGSLEAFNEAGLRTLGGLQLHHDAIVALEPWEEDLISVGADGSIVRVSHLLGESPSWETLADFDGRSVVGHSLCRQSGLLWIGLEEGFVTWLSLSGAEQTGEFQLQACRVEEIRSAGPGSAMVLTDRGSVKHLRIDL